MGLMDACRGGGSIAGLRGGRGGREPEGTTALSGI